MVCPEETPKLRIEDVLCVWPAIKTHLYNQDEDGSLLKGISGPAKVVLFTKVIIPFTSWLLFR